VLDGMSGALVIDGIESYFPALTGLPERILVVRGRVVANDFQSTDLKQRVELGSYVCGGKPETPTEVMTVNGSVRPQIEIAPGERQFWRLVNASADRYLDLQLEGQTFEIVAMDGMPIARHDPGHPTRVADHVLLPPVGRLEAIVYWSIGRQATASDFPLCGYWARRRSEPRADTGRRCSAIRSRFNA
jgi:suppressor of ftsI